jgi:hypothetical protein
MDRSEFLSYFAWRSQEDLSYAPPEPEAVDKVLAAAVDRIDVESYQPQFDALYALIVDDASKGRWGGELKKNEMLTGLANLPPAERAKHIVVAAQMLSWLDDLENVVQRRRPRCAIAQAAAAWTIGLVGKFKGYPPEQLANLIRASAGCTSMDTHIIVTRGKLLQIMASYAKEIPRDTETRAALAQFLTNVKEYELPTQADLKAIAKLEPIASGEEPEPKTTAAKKKSPPKPEKTKAIRESDLFWELPAESELRAAIIPNPPQPKKQATVRLTHANSYGPFDDAKFFVRIGDLENPTNQAGGNSVTDWTACTLVEELVYIDGQYLPRSAAKEPFTDEVPWEGTYETKLKLPADPCTIEIKVVSEHPDVPSEVVLSDWDVSAE